MSRNRLSFGEMTPPSEGETSEGAFQMACFQGCPNVIRCRSFDFDRVAQRADRLAWLGILVVLVAHRALLEDDGDRRSSSQIAFAASLHDLLVVVLALAKLGHGGFFEVVTR